MTIEEKIARYTAKLEEKEKAKNEERADIIKACQDLIDAIAIAPASAKRELAPVLGRLTAFVKGEKYFTRNKGAKNDED